MKNNINSFLARLKSTDNLKGGIAIDIGARTGKDCIFLKENGYKVTAVDKNIDLLKTNLNEADFDIVEGDISNINLGKEKYDLVLANNVLPFVHKNRIADTIINITNAVKRDGFFCFSLFGKEDEWNGKEMMNFHTYQESLNILSGLPLDIFFQSTEKGYGPTMKGNTKFWEMHKFIVKKR